MMNPGYQVYNGTVLHPPLNSDPDPNLVDFIFSRRLFTMYLPNQCNPAFPRQHGIMTTIASENDWPKPVPVYGYDDTDPVLGGKSVRGTCCQGLAPLEIRRPSEIAAT